MISEHHVVVVVIVHAKLHIFLCCANMIISVRLCFCLSHFFACLPPRVILALILRWLPCQGKDLKSACVILGCHFAITLMVVVVLVNVDENTLAAVWLVYWMLNYYSLPRQFVKTQQQVIATVANIIDFACSIWTTRRVCASVWRKMTSHVVFTTSWCDNNIQ